MIRRLMLSVCVVLLCTSVVYAAAASVGKVRDLFPKNGENEYADGVATLVWKEGKDIQGVGASEVSVVIQGFKPNTPYYVRFLGPGGVGGPIVTNPAGNGSFKTSNPVSADPMSAPNILEVFINEDFNEQWDGGERGATGLVE